MKMMEIIETMKLILKIGVYGCLIIVTAIVFVFLVVCLIEVLRSFREKWVINRKKM